MQRGVPARDQVGVTVFHEPFASGIGSINK